MYCPKCGTEIENGSYNCTSCDWTWEEVENELKNENAEQIVSSSDEVRVSETIEEQNAVVDIDEKTNKNAFDWGNILAFLKNKKVLMSGLLILAAIAVIIGPTIIYQNLDSTKIRRATEQIANGQYSVGLEEIMDVYTPQAIAIKEFVAVEEAKNAFVNSMGSNIDKVSEAYFDFGQALNTFKEDNESYYLPEILKEKYDCYETAYDYVSDYTSELDNHTNELLDAVYTVQSVMMNEVDRNNSSKDGSTYTLQRLQNRVDYSQEALQTLEAGESYTSDFRIIIDDLEVQRCCNTITYLLESDEKQVVECSSYFYTLMDDLMKYCQWEIEDCQEQIDESAKEFDMDDDLYLILPDENYSSFVGDKLERIGSYEDMNTNQEIVRKILKTDMLYYLIVGSSAQR